MEESIQIISLSRLALAFIPAAAVIFILYKWSMNSTNALYAVVRMLTQLLLVGYFLTYLFQSENAAVIIAVLTVMLIASSWISLNAVNDKDKKLYLKSLISISIGGITTLVIITRGVLDFQPWFKPQFLIPLGGMIFANAMNTVSLAAERFEAETKNSKEYFEARSTALRASLIPITNSLFAVGLVSLPGMMTGQILSGIEPSVAVRYQIMVMCMIFGSAGISSTCFLWMLKPVNSESTT